MTKSKSISFEEKSFDGTANGSATTANFSDKLSISGKTISEARMPMTITESRLAQEVTVSIASKPYFK